MRSPGALPSAGVVPWQSSSLFLKRAPYAPPGKVSLTYLSMSIFPQRLEIFPPVPTASLASPATLMICHYPGLARLLGLLLISLWAGTLLHSRRASVPSHFSSAPPNLWPPISQHIATYGALLCNNFSGASPSPQVSQELPHCSLPFHPCSSQG